MKKIILGTVFLLSLCAGAARADIIRPGETPWWQGLDRLSKEEKLKECQKLKRENANIEKEHAVLPSKKKWNMLGCEQLLKEHAEKQNTANPNETTPQTAPNSNAPAVAPGEADDKHDIRSYGFAGILMLLLSGGACVLLWRSRKPNFPRAL